MSWLQEGVHNKLFLKGFKRCLWNLRNPAASLGKKWDMISQKKQLKKKIIFLR